MMDDQNDKDVQLQSPPDEDRIIESLQITEQILTILGEAWSRIDELESELAKVQAKKPSVSPVKVQAKPKITEGAVIVDDSKIMQIRLRSTIETIGFKVIGTAENGQLGAELVVKSNPQLLVLDHQMPDMGGIECLKAIRLQNPDVRVILCTAGITEQESQDYLKLDISAIITKPIQLDRFVTAVRDCMAYDPAEANQELENLVENL